MSGKDGRLDVGIVGAGRVGPVIGAGLAGAGHRISGVATTSAAGRDRVEALLGDVPILDLPTLLARSDLVVLAIPGAEIASLVRGLADAGHWRAGTLVAHTAPDLGTEVLLPAVERGAIPLAIHPAIVFTGTSIDLVRLRDAVCAVTAPGPVLPIAQALVVELGAEPVVVAERDRPAYAEAIATATAFSAAIVRQSLEILAGIGVERPAGVVAPLIRSTIDEAPSRSTGAARSRTGLRIRPRLTSGSGFLTPKPIPQPVPTGRRGPVPRVHESIGEVRAAAAAARSEGRRIALVPTMGALHPGHLRHVERARELDPTAFVVVSVFINPLQFAAGEDFERYPRTLDDDLAKLAGVGADAVFAPSVAEMYPDGGALITVNAGRVGSVFEGRARPGHFDGALTVVAKLLQIVGPDVATFGRKDAQQLWLVERMVRDLDIPTRIEEIEIVREPDGLAMSSRNRFLSGGERAAALALSRALAAAESEAAAGIDAVLAAGQSILSDAKGVETDYFALVDRATFSPVPEGFRGPVIALVAAHVGATRLIDNAAFRLG